jgi:hypothetical protein
MRIKQIKHVLFTVSTKKYLRTKANNGELFIYELIMI